jgi:DNA-binding Xre family transcriptional regulator
MPMIWKLREWLRSERDITRAAEVSRIILERTGRRLSTQAICDLLNDKPRMLRLETIQAICDALSCRLSDFCEVIPAPTIRLPPEKRPLFGSGSLSDSLMGRAEPGARRNQQINDDSSQAVSTVDFAAFFPDARTFSSAQTRAD